MKRNKKINGVVKKIYHKGILGKSILLTCYVIFGTFVLYVALFALKKIGAPAEMISDAAGIGEVVVAIVAAIMIIYQLEQEREVEQRENQIQEAGFIVQCNQIFLENEKMQYIESCLMNEDMGICTLEERWDDEMLQDCVNYLVYLEGIAPLILANIIKIETIDNLFAYRYFIAVNNPLLQKKSLDCYDRFYKGCFMIYKEWRNYRINTHCATPFNERYRDVIPMAEFELDQLSCYHKYAKIDLINEMSNGKDICRQLTSNETIQMNKLYEIAKLIYDTDPYIYPALFESRVDAIEMIAYLILTRKDEMFTLDNIFVIENDKEVKGIILWKKGPLAWSRILFKEIAKEKKIRISEHFDYVCDKYFDSYNDVSLDNKISLINVCVNSCYRGIGLGKRMLEEFLKKHKKEEIELCVLKDNKKAVELYKEAGFNVVAERKGFSVNDEKPGCLDMVRTEKYRGEH